MPRGGSKGGDKLSKPELHQQRSENLVGGRAKKACEQLIYCISIRGSFFRAMPHLEHAPVPWWAALIPPVGTVRLSIASRPTTAKAVSYEAGVKLVGPIWVQPGHILSCEELGGGRGSFIGGHFCFDDILHAQTT